MGTDSMDLVFTSTDAQCGCIVEARVGACGDSSIGRALDFEIQVPGSSPSPTTTKIELEHFPGTT